MLEECNIISYSLVLDLSKKTKKSMHLYITLSELQQINPFWIDTFLSEWRDSVLWIEEWFPETRVTTRMKQFMIAFVIVSH